jgi:hypothetical protein
MGSVFQKIVNVFQSEKMGIERHNAAVYLLLSAQPHLISMRKIFFVLLFLPFAAMSQPSFDTVSKGIHTITKKICGYMAYGDSTGIILDEISEYNTHGQRTKVVRRNEIQELVESEAEDEEPEGQPWYNKDHGNYLDPKHPYDTSRYQFNAKFQLVKYSSRDYDGKLLKEVYTYDANGNCILQVFYRDGKEEYRYTWKYNAHNDMINETRTNTEDAPHKTKRLYYDENNRLIADVNVWVNVIDSTAYTYNPGEKIKTVYHSNGSFDREVFDKHDSLLSAVRYFNNSTYKGGTRFYLFDSTSVSRNAAGISVNYFKIVHFNEYDQITTRKFDEHGRILEELVCHGNKKYTHDVYTFDEERHVCVKRHYGFHYTKEKLGDTGQELLKSEYICLHDKQNHLTEERYLDGHDELLERIVYSYTFY